MGERRNLQTFYAYVIRCNISAGAYTVIARGKHILKKSGRYQEEYWGSPSWETNSRCLWCYIHLLKF